MISLTVKLTENDYYEYLLYKAEKKLANQTIAQKVRTRFLGSLVTAIPFFLIIGYLRDYQKALNIIIVYLAVMNIIPFLGIKKKKATNSWYRSMIKADARRIMKDPKYNDNFALSEFSFSETGITILHLQEKTIKNWADIKSLDETPCLLLLEGETEGFLMIIPKNTVPDMAAFRVLLSNHLSFHAEVGHKIKI